MSPFVMPSSGHHTLCAFEITTPPIVSPSLTGAALFTVRALPRVLLCVALLERHQVGGAEVDKALGHRLVVGVGEPGLVEELPARERDRELGLGRDAVLRHDDGDAAKVQ